jgi:hypothetical protein
MLTFVKYEAIFVSLMLQRVKAWTRQSTKAGREAAGEGL